MTNRELKKLRFLQRLEKTLDGKEKEAARKERSRLEAFVEKVEDPVIKRIMQLHYVKGWTWQRVAIELGWINESTPRMMVQSYLKLCDSCDFGQLK